jgi:hypothetical protein
MDGKWALGAVQSANLTALFCALLPANPWQCPAFFPLPCLCIKQNDSHHDETVAAKPPTIATARPKGCTTMQPEHAWRCAASSNTRRRWQRQRQRVDVIVKHLVLVQQRQRHWIGA